jgi:hypothetical protein
MTVFSRNCSHAAEIGNDQLPGRLAIPLFTPLSGQPHLLGPRHARQAADLATKQGQAIQFPNCCCHLSPPCIIQLKRHIA